MMRNSNLSIFFVDEGQSPKSETARKATGDHSEDDANESDSYLASRGYLNLARDGAEELDAEGPSLNGPASDEEEEAGAGNEEVDLIEDPCTCDGDENGYCICNRYDDNEFMELEGRIQPEGSPMQNLASDLEGVTVRDIAWLTPSPSTSPNLCTSPSPRAETSSSSSSPASSSSFSAPSSSSSSSTSLTSSTTSASASPAIATLPVPARSPTPAVTSESRPALESPTSDDELPAFRLPRLGGQGWARIIEIARAREAKEKKTEETLPVVESTQSVYFVPIDNSVATEILPTSRTPRYMVELAEPLRYSPVNGR